MLFTMSSRSTLLRVAIIALLSSCSAFQFISKDTFPASGLSAGCVAALTKDIYNCPRHVGKFGTRSYFAVEALEEACTADCTASLVTYSSTVNSACGPTDVYNITDTRTAPVSFLPELLHYHFTRTCIRDGDRWCNRVAYDMSGGITNSARTFASNETSLHISAINGTADSNTSTETLPFPNISESTRSHIKILT